MTAQSPVRQFERWYDQYNNISVVYSLSEELTPHQQLEVGQNLVETLQDYHKNFELSAFRNLGPETVLCLYKSQKRLRWYDQIAPFHTAMDRMILLPKPLIEHFETRCDSLAKYIESEVQQTRQRKAAYQQSQLAAKKIVIRDEGGRIIGDPL